jgi:cell division protein ZapA
MENTPSDKKTVRVTILSRPYALRTSGDPREVEQVAASVDELMLSIAAKAPDADSTRIAVLACLHLADKVRELELELKDVHHLRRELNEKTERFSGMIDKLLAEAGEGR